MTKSRNTTRIASQSGSSFTAARVTYIDTSSALSATGSSSAPTELPPPLRLASQPSSASDRPAARNTKNASISPCSRTNHTAIGTMQSRANVMTFGKVSSVVDRALLTLVPSGIDARLPCGCVP